MMSVESERLKRRSKDFAHRSVKLAAALPNTALGRHISGQLIRCSTSVAANYRAACLAQSRRSFLAKLAIVIEEIDESCFWLGFLIDEQLFKAERVRPFLSEGEELRAIFLTSRQTARRSLKQKQKRPANDETA